MFRFENIHILYLLLINILIVIFFLFTRYIDKRNLKKFCDANLLPFLNEKSSIFKKYFKLILILFAFSSMVVGLANPQLGTKLIEAKREGIDIVIALDISNSMLAEDVKPNRLERAKQVISKIIDNAKGDRIGLIVFAGYSYPQLPLTTDYSAIKMILNAVNPSIIPTQGTDIASAIELAIKSYNVNAEKEKVLIIITDGEYHEQDPIDITKEAVKNNFRIYTIGFGSLEGAPIPIVQGQGISGFMKNAEGEFILTKLDAETLEKIASYGNGKFFYASSGDINVEKLMNEFSSIQKEEFSSKIYSDFENQFQYLFILAFVLLLLETILSENKWNIFERFKFFRKN